MLDTAIILAGGLGTRLRPLTDTTPKPLLPMKGKPILQHVIENLKRYGIKKIILSIGYQAESIKNYFQDKDLGVNLSYSIESEPLGTGGAIKQAAQGLEKPFFLVWGDNLMTLDYNEMYKTYLRDAPQITMALTPREDVENFGVAVLEGNKIKTFVEKPAREAAPSNLINAGAFIIDPHCLKILPEGKSSMERDCFEKLAPLGEISAYEHQGQWFPTDTLEKYNFANEKFKPINKEWFKLNFDVFRGYDIRGIAEKDFNKESIEIIGKAYGEFLKRSNINKVVVGRDCRLTSKSYSQAVIKGLNWAGIDVINIGMTLVGTLYWAQYFLKCPGGVYITASHNPAEYNGLKLANGYSETLVSEGIQTVRKIVEEESYQPGNVMGSLEEENIKLDYFQDLKSKLKINKKFKIVVDPSHSTAGIIVPEILRNFGMEVIEKNCNINGNFPLGTPDPTEKDLAERLSKEVLEEKADLGFSYDADGDRIGIIDDKGRIIWNDTLVALFAMEVLRRHPGEKIMFNTLCSKVVPETIKKYGGCPFMWRTGHSFLKKKNQEVKAAFIGELSGHFFFSKDYYNHDDGIYSTLRLLQYLSSTKQSLSEAVDKLANYFSSPEIKVGCLDKSKVEVMDKIAIKLRKDFPHAEIIDDERAGDGVRLDEKDSMFIVRYSQNGPYLTIKFEATTSEKYNQLKRYINELLHFYNEIDWGFGVNVDSLK